MKSRTLLPAVFALLFPAGAALAGYGALSREVDGYAPPPQVLGAPPSFPAAPSPAAPDDFAVEASRLRALAEGWEKALSAPAPEEAFLVPDKAMLARMSGIAADDNAVLSALSGTFTLEGLEVLALLRNPAVAAKEREFRAVLDGYSQAENLDTILRRYGTFTPSQMTGVGPMGSPEGMAAERFPFPGILALKGQVVTQDAKAVREELEAARRDAVTSVRKGYRELLYLREALRVTDMTRELLDALKKTATARYSTGETSYQDVVRTAVELEKIREGQLTLAGELENTEGMVRETLALPPAAPIGIPAEGGRTGAVPPLDVLLATARERRQELRRMRAMVGKMERMVELQETMILPPFTLGLSVPSSDPVSRVVAGGAMEGGRETEAFPTATDASTGSGLPKNPLFGTNDAWLRELRQRLEALREDLRAEEAATDLAVRTARFTLDKAKREEALYADRVVTLSRGALEASAKGYSTGKVTFSDVLESYMGWFEANLSRERRRADVGIAWAGLEAAVGAVLPAVTDREKGPTAGEAGPTGSGGGER